ncbi:CidA/LrgA family protein [Lysinibacillus sp. SGAir0095]|uniref:CidA/LrgA family protein n=1 Tax=Lysinibacillus sp. SGAir0095 TaxID=2070463 RepID=UPI001F0D89D3|nr:CidA/LrgA family protein [Lysinibacillus sp. SGAir0095]
MAIKVGALSYCLMMRIIRTIAQILILYVFYYIGVFIVEITGLPLPASILGLVLLAFCLQMKWVKVEYIREGAGFLIAFMTLFFIPPIVGIIDYPQLLSVEGILLLGTVFVSTLFAILISSKFSEIIEKKELELIEKKEFKITLSKEQEMVMQNPSEDEPAEVENHFVPISLDQNNQQPNAIEKEGEALEGNHLHR